MPATPAVLVDDPARTLAEIWAELLDLDPDAVPADVSFLRLGGDSVLAVRMSALVRRRLGVQLALTDVRVDTTLAELAALTSRRIEGGVSTAALPVQLRRRDDPQAPFPLLPLQQGYFVGQQHGWELSYDSAHYYLDLALSDLDPDEAPDALADALRRLAVRQPTLRARVTPDGHQRVLPVDVPGAIPTPRVLDLRADPEPQARLAQVRREMSHHGPDPTHGPGVDIRLTLLPEGHGRLHLSLSLLLVDGWSSNVLTRELLTLAADWNATLPPLGMDFADYVVTLADLPASPAWTADRDWWRAHLAHLPQPPALPLARDPRTVAPATMTNRESRLPATTWAAVRQRCAEHGVTPSSALLAGYAAVLARWAGHHRMLLNTLQLNRLPLHPDIHRVVGAFASTMLLPLDLAPDATVADLAAHTHRRLGDHAVHNLVSGVEVARDLARSRGSRRPVAPVVFLSTIGMDAAMGERAPRHAGPLGTVDVVNHHHQLRTPQVAIEARLFELHDELAMVFSTVEEIFDPVQVDRAFADFTAYAAALAEPDTWTAPVSLPTVADPTVPVPGVRLGQPDDAPNPDGTAESGGTGPVPGPPRDDLEQRIAAVFGAVLGEPVHDRAGDFFALGGDSLLAVRALAALARDDLAGMSIQDFLAAPTVAGVADAVR